MMVGALQDAFRICLIRMKLYEMRIKDCCKLKYFILASLMFT